jgi:hypothetical protein
MNNIHKLHQPPLVKIEVCLLQDGSLSIQGPLGDPEWMIRALQHAIDAIRSSKKPSLVIPPAHVNLE